MCIINPCWYPILDLPIAQLNLSLNFGKLFDGLSGCKFAFPMPVTVLHLFYAYLFRFVLFPIPVIKFAEY